MHLQQLAVTAGRHHVGKPSGAKRPHVIPNFARRSLVLSELRRAVEVQQNLLWFLFAGIMLGQLFMIEPRSSAGRHHLKNHLQHARR